MSDNDMPAYGARRAPGEHAEPVTTGAPYQPGGPEAHYDPYRGSTPQVGGPAPHEPGKLPGRGLPITLIVLGAIIAFLLAPIVGLVAGVGSFVGGVDFDQIEQQAKGTATGENPKTIDAEANDVIVILLSDESERDATCEVTGADGAQVKVAGNQEQQGITSHSYVVEEKGAYTVACTRADGSPATSMQTMSMSVGAMGSSALIAGGITFLVGLAMLVGGIIWLVKRNKQRRAMMSSYRM